MSDEDWNRVGVWIDERTSAWTTADYARHGVDRKTLDKARAGEKVRADARRRLSLALGVGDDGLDRMARGEDVSAASADQDARLSRVERELAELRAALEAVVRQPARGEG